jgi:formiminoglutamate deiminase
VTSYWCELAWLGGERAAAGVVVEVDGARIASIRPDAPVPPPGSTSLDGLTLPGLANAHSHAFQRALRGRTHAGGGSFWTWREQMYRLAERLDPDSYRLLARATFAEMALAGISCVGEFHYVHHGAGGVPYEDPNEMGRAMIAAAAEAGIRITLLDACYLHGGIGEPPGDTQRRFSDGSAEVWASRVEGLAEAETVRVGAAIHSVRAVDPASAALVAGWAAERGRPLHAHVSEQPAENRACLDAHGRTPTGVLRDAGALDAPFTAVHMTHPQDDDLALLGQASAHVCACPTTERDLADGIGPMRHLDGAGAALALGSDSHASIDMFEEARAVELDERLATGERGLHPPDSLLRAATEAGHAALGWPDAGRIAAGARADLVTVALDGVRLAGTRPGNAIEAVVFAAGAADVRHVVVDGREVVRDGRHQAIDVARALDDAVGEVLA